jgi:hypothetical protein
MANKAQVRKTLEKVAMFFAEKGEVLEQAKYIKQDDKPIPLSHIRRIFRSYSRMVTMLERNEPELWLIATKPALPEVKIEKPKMEMPKPKPVKIDLPKAEPAKAEVNKDGKNI